MSNNPINLSWNIAGVEIGLRLTTRLADRDHFDSEYGWLSKPFASLRGDSTARKAAGNLLLNVEFAPPWATRGNVEVDERFFRAAAKGKAVAFECSDFVGTLHNRSGSVYEADFKLRDTAFPALQTVIRICLSHVLADQGELLLHAAGVVRDGKLFVFSGASGTGKTTIATELRAGGTAFCVDRVVIGVRQDGRIISQATPFSDTDGILEPHPPHEVSGIFFIEQGDHDALARCNSHHAAKLLLRDGMPPSRNSDRDTRLLGVIETICHSRLCYNLVFRRRPDFWALIDSATNEPVGS